MKLMHPHYLAAARTGAIAALAVCLSLSNSQAFAANIYSQLAQVGGNSLSSNGAQVGPNTRKADAVSASGAIFRVEHRHLSRRIYLRDRRRQY